MNVRRMKLALLAAISTSLLIVSAAAQQPSQDTMRKASQYRRVHRPRDLCL